MMKVACQQIGIFLCFFTAMAAEETRELAPLLVEAPRASVIPAHFAGNATVIPAGIIANAGVRSLAELLTTHGGVRITNTSGNSALGTVSLRGFGENSASRVLILIDGRPINRPDTAAVSLLEVPLSRISQVEILRGSQTARFGDHAVGGVINIITKSPDQPRTSVEVAAGSDHYTLVRLAHDARYHGNGISLDFERNFSDGWRDNSAVELQSAALRWDRQITATSELEMGYSWADEFSEFPGPLSTEEYRKNPRQSIYPDSAAYFSEQRTQRGDAAILLGKGHDLTLDIPLSFSSRDQSWNLGPGSHTDNLLETLACDPVLRLAKQKWSWDLGLRVQQDSLTLDQYAQISRITRTGDAMLKRQQVAAFSTLEWQPFDGWHLSTAARWQTSRVDASARSYTFPGDESLNFSRINDEENHAYQLGIRWEPKADLSLWLRYDQLYRLPSTDEIASYQGFPLTVPFNDRLTAETGFNCELGSEYAKNHWNFRTTAFLQQLDGEIAYDYLQNLNVNFANTRRVGAEFSVSYETPFWNANLHYTWLDASYRDGEYNGKDIYLVPNHELSAIVAIRPLPKWLIQCEYQFTSAAYEGNDFTNDTEKLPAYAVANLLLRYQPLAGLSYYLRVNNLLEETYATVKYSGVWYPAAGRTVQAGIRYEF